MSSADVCIATVCHPGLAESTDRAEFKFSMRLEYQAIAEDTHTCLLPLGAAVFFFFLAAGTSGKPSSMLQQKMT